MASLISKKKAESMQDLIQVWLKANHIKLQVDTHRIFNAWDEVTGTGAYTIRRFYRDGHLYVTMTSSLVRSQLLMRKSDILAEMNRRLCCDPLFCTRDKEMTVVKELTIR